VLQRLTGVFFFRIHIFVCIITRHEIARRPYPLRGVQTKTLDVSERYQESVKSTTLWKCGRIRKPDLTEFALVRSSFLMEHDIRPLFAAPQTLQVTTYQVSTTSTIFILFLRSAAEIHLRQPIELARPISSPKKPRDRHFGRLLTCPVAQDANIIINPRMHGE
jgi:hypothetical protein